MENWIITGASRGLGAALARQSLRADRRIVCIARGGNEALEFAARDVPCYLEYLKHDLADAQATAALADRILADLPRDAKRWVLINNAGMVEPVARGTALDACALERAIAVNLTAALLLSSRLVAATAGLATERRILHISSGAGRNPVAGWGVYCSLKAALDMHARTLNADAAGEPQPVRAVSLAPGVIDTTMQATIRASDAAQFPQVARFRALKDQGQLQDADAVAARILTYLERDDYGTREIDDIRNY